MKKSFIITISVICALVICSSLFVSALGNNASAVKVNKTEEVTDVRETNLLSMLNHNFVYGDDFDNADELVNCSLNALLKFKDVDDDYIMESYVTDFVNNMYGVDIVDLSALNADYPHKDGYVFVVPGGITRYEHSNITLTENEDGTVSANTDVTIFDHDGNKQVLTATSLFVPNEDSDFGYNIVYSEIIESGISL